MILAMIAAMAATAGADQRAAAHRRSPHPVVAAPNATLGDIRMHLFYQETGRLSPDISPPHEFTGWNTSIGEGSAEENATDLLVVVELRSDGQQNVNRATIVTAHAGGRVIGQRSFATALTGENGRAYLPLWLKDMDCAGHLQVDVTFGREHRTEALALMCGE